MTEPPTDTGSSRTNELETELGTVGDDAGLDDDEVAPARLSHYVLLHELGRGGTGVVHAAYDEILDRKVAIKLLRSRGSERAQRRLLREAQALAKLSHSNVVQIYEIGHADPRRRGRVCRGMDRAALEHLRGPAAIARARRASRPGDRVPRRAASGAGRVARGVGGGRRQRPHAGLDGDLAPACDRLVRRRSVARPPNACAERRGRRAATTARSSDRVSPGRQVRGQPRALAGDHGRCRADRLGPLAGRAAARARPGARRSRRV
ncbi:protein kinase domain-containing protein [Nannocystaceae bacterium ST9]